MILYQIHTQPCPDSIANGIVSDIPNSLLPVTVHELIFFLSDTHVTATIL